MGFSDPRVDALIDRGSRPTTSASGRASTGSSSGSSRRKPGAVRLVGSRPRGARCTARASSTGDSSCPRASGRGSSRSWCCATGSAAGGLQRRNEADLIPPREQVRPVVRLVAATDRLRHDPVGVVAPRDPAAAVDRVAQHPAGMRAADLPVALAARHIGCAVEPRDATFVDLTQTACSRAAGGTRTGDTRRCPHLRPAAGRSARMRWRPSDDRPDRCARTPIPDARRYLRQELLFLEVRERDAGGQAWTVRPWPRAGRRRDGRPERRPRRRRSRRPRTRTPAPIRDPARTDPRPGPICHRTARCGRSRPSRPDTGPWLP